MLLCFVTEQSDALMSGIFRAFLENETAIRRVLARYIKRRETIDDLVQETFLRSFAAEITEEIREPKRYLLRTARNLAISEVKKHSNTQTDFLADSRASEVLKDEASVTPEEQIDSKRKLVLFCEAIASLPESYRAPLLLRKMEDLKFKQIAMRLNITVSTAEKRVARALAMCQSYMRARGYSPANDTAFGSIKRERPSKGGDVTSEPEDKSAHSIESMAEGGGVI